MKKLFLLFMVFVGMLFSYTFELKQGWNLIGPNCEISLETIKQEIGESNLLVIQGPVKTYQKTYVDQGLNFLNDFTGFELGKGYWVKVVKNATFECEQQVPTSPVIKLNNGWNLIAPYSELDLNEILNQVGESNLLVIQGPVKTYQKTYVDQGLNFLNDFTGFELGKGYWVKVVEDSQLNFDVESSSQSSSESSSESNSQSSSESSVEPAPEPEASSDSGLNLPPSPPSL